MTEPLSYEASILHAALDGDLAEMIRLIADSLPGERAALAEACYRIAADVSLYCAGCGGKLDPQGPFAAVHPGTWHPHCARQRTAEQEQEENR